MAKSLSVMMVVTVHDDDADPVEVKNQIVNMADSVGNGMTLDVEYATVAVI